MKTLIYSLAAIILIVSCKNDNIMENNVTSLFSEFQDGLTPGASVSIVKKGNIIYKKGFGYADLEAKKNIESNTNFRLASITKQFTALSILILENDGKLTLDDKLKKFFPEFPEYGNKITIKNILQHTSGLLAYEDFVDETDTLQLNDMDVLEIIINQDSTYFEPGSEHRYSNTGYAVLTLLVEKISGLKFPQFLEERIFKPLDMNKSVAFVNGTNEVPNRSFGYTNTDSGFVFSDQSLTSAILGDGGIYSSVDDLIKWDKEVDSPTLLPKEKFKMIFEKGKTNEGTEFDYGFGWRLDPYNKINRIYHTGSTCGFSNIYMKLPEYDLTVIVLINIRDYDAKGFAEKIADIAINY